ncbi:GAF domain-containing protein [Olivibacter sitiensis]|uniref:GAF domain-containing protein n=1 Tax=Olivibacter sitiensis TaxID=376470 RepID=UPI00042106B8|nr:GAF domain-containing protein [Olivibacter sitiensis]
MAEEIQLSVGDKKAQYESLIPQIKALISGEPNLVANLANVSAALKAQFDFLWVGFYLVDKEELVLGPFQGPIACTRIKKGNGVCGAAWARNEAIVVPDVDAFPGHIACSSLSRSEIVVPFYSSGEVTGVLDIDSASLNTFDELDIHYLTSIVNLFSS